LVSSFIKKESIPSLIVTLILIKELSLCLSKDILDEYKEVLNRTKFSKLIDKYHIEIKEIFDFFPKRGIMG
jgi:predicted nucleic acid-binding protein